MKKLYVAFLFVTYFDGTLETIFIELVFCGCCHIVNIMAIDFKDSCQLMYNYLNCRYFVKYTNNIDIIITFIQ